jgi:lipid-A-disaccharide synthase
LRYYLIAGEASGDLHASHLMKSLQLTDPQASFRFFGGDMMAAVGGTLVKHYRELAYMGFVPVLLHLPTILRNMKMCKQDIRQWKPDVVILVDYPGFNLSIAQYVHAEGICPVYYYISPKIWAWKEYRIKNIRRDVDKLFSILPFEVDFFEKKYHYPIHYVGNPTASEVKAFREGYQDTFSDFCTKNDLDPQKPIIALLAGSRRQEIKDNLPTMMQVGSQFSDYQLVLAGAPSIDDAYYARFLQSPTAPGNVHLVKNQTYALLSHAHAALVTSGTATLETALFRVPQVVCYETPLPRLIGWLRKKVLNVKYISLVDLVADAEVVKELVADTFKPELIRQELQAILSGELRNRMLEGYEEVSRRLGTLQAPDEAARLIAGYLQSRA